MGKETQYHKKERETKYSERDKELPKPNMSRPPPIKTAQGIIDTKLVHYFPKDPAYTKGGLAIVWDTDYREHPLSEHLKVDENAVHQIALEPEEAISSLEEICKIFELEIVPLQLQPLGMQFYNYCFIMDNPITAKNVVKEMVDKYGGL